MNYNAVLQEIREEIRPFERIGKLPDYIPELAKIRADQFGISLHFLDGADYHLGDYQTKFSIQSISKVLSVSLAFSMRGDEIWNRVGVEPSGSSFNSLVQLEYENGIPRNPLINAGALVIADILVTHLNHPKEDFLHFVRELSGVETVSFNSSVARSEHQNGYRNAALANFLKSFGNIKNDISEVLDFYYHQCSIEMTCQELTSAFLVFANGGEIPQNKRKILTGSQTKRLNALMQTCGFYDEAGEFTFKVGLPGKSGVGGGIAAVCPGKYAVTVWSPKLNEKGNSVLGMKALELLTTKTGQSIF